MQQFIPVLMVVTLALCGCERKDATSTYAGADLPPDAAGNTAASGHTAALNKVVADNLSLSDAQDFEDAMRGLIASDAALRIVGADGAPIWDMPAYDFVEGEAPVSVNPSLWRQAQLNNIHGLFEVTRGVYQLRGYDLANMSLIEGDTGWIVVDPLTAEETARGQAGLCGDFHPQPRRSLRWRAGSPPARGSGSTCGARHRPGILHRRGDE
jgi:alkyl sulfatase BDS1-like metallo-beta-lactamase superfamily hydrolase